MATLIISNGKMKLNETLTELFEELDRIHPGGHADAKVLRNPGQLPIFTTTSSGVIRYFSEGALKLIQLTASTLLINDTPGQQAVDELVYRNVVRESVAEVHVFLSKDGKTSSDETASEIKAMLKAEVAERLSELTKQFKHYFPASTSGFGRNAAFDLGPVSIMGRELWLQRVDFSPTAKATYLNLSVENEVWKDKISMAMQSGDPEIDLQGLARAIWPAISRHGYIVSITIEGKDRVLSRRLAEIVCRAALDGLSLMFGDIGFFEHQILCSESRPPGLVHTMLETNGHLWLPGSYAGRERRDLQDAVLKDMCANNADYIISLGEILNSVVAPISAANPLLSQRWATALNWYAEGARERNSAIALAKFGSSLDVLASGGKALGITNMLENLLGCKSSTIVVTGEKQKTLSDLVKEIYDAGRSQILHGNHINQLKSFDESKAYAWQLARLALMVAATRLASFSGLDGNDKAFRSMQ